MLFGACACIFCYHAGMRKQATSIQYTIRGVPRDVDQILRRKAAQRRQSLNQVILDELVAVTSARTQKEDFSDLVGQWTPDPAFDETMAGHRQIDREKWK